MTEIFDKLRNWLNLGVVPLLGICLFSGFLIFLPNSFITELGLLDFISTYKTFIGLAFFFSISFLTAAILNALWRIFLGPKLKETANLYFLRKEAHSLTEDEKDILRGFIENQTRSAMLSMKNGVVLGLEKRMFIVRVGKLGNDPISWSFPFNIQPWAWEYLNKKPDLLDPKS